MIRTDRLVSDLFTRHGLTAKLEEHRLIAAWPTIVGPQIAAHAVPTEIRSHTLRVSVDSSPWLHELSLLKPVLLTKLERFAKHRLVRDVLFVIGEVPRRAPTGPAPKPLRSLSVDEERQVAETIGALKDPELRVVAERLLRRALTDLSPPPG